MTPLKALTIFKSEKLIESFESASAAVTHIRMTDPSPETVAATLAMVTGVNSYNEEFITRDENNIEREREIYNRYLVNYLSVYCIRDRYIETDAQFKNVYVEAVDKAIFATNERLYGSNTWIDAVTRSELAVTQKQKTKGNTSMSQETHIIKQVDGNILPTTKQLKPKPVQSEKKPRGGKVAAINARVIELYVTEEKTRAETLAIITKEFDMQKPITAVTYFNGALQIAKVKRRQGD